jgi:hypothetical protein
VRSRGGCRGDSAAHIAAKDDALLEALLTELDRTKQHLKMDKVQPPYYIEYRVNDVDDYSAERHLERCGRASDNICGC